MITQTVIIHKVIKLPIEDEREKNSGSEKKRDQQDSEDLGSRESLPEDKKTRGTDKRHPSKKRNKDTLMKKNINIVKKSITQAENKQQQASTARRTRKMTVGEGSPDSISDEFEAKEKVEEQKLEEKGQGKIKEIQDDFTY